MEFFLNISLEKGVSKKQLFGYIDENKIKNLKKNFQNINNFDSTLKFEKKFDIFIGNPPYAGDESYFIRENRKRLIKIINRSKLYLALYP